jgi:hypothetical protein
MFPDGKGGLWFGWVDHIRMRKGEDFFGTSALYRLDPDGRVTRHFGGVGFSNGIGLSPSGDRLYFTDSAAGAHDFPVRADGSLGEPVLRGEPGGDGLVVDSEGGVWTAAIQDGTVEPHAARWVNGAARRSARRPPRQPYFRGPGLARPLRQHGRARRWHGRDQSLPARGRAPHGHDLPRAQRRGRPATAQDGVSVLKAIYRPLRLYTRHYSSYLV